MTPAGVSSRDEALKDIIPEEIELELREAELRKRKLQILQRCDLNMYIPSENPIQDDDSPSNHGHMSSFNFDDVIRTSRGDLHAAENRDR
ncbi:unnamed protein product [Echinostoma caproni]|uniref:Phosphatase and actin regulator n=1 Tax=Echinostoma caproni TaxID=27848 RepID=A0A183AHS7_9TREM|nr:unnamed protein product [Echinostoma caproni]